MTSEVIKKITAWRPSSRFCLSVIGGILVSGALSILLSFGAEWMRYHNGPFDRGQMNLAPLLGSIFVILLALPGEVAGVLILGWLSLDISESFYPALIFFINTAFYTMLAYWWHGSPKS